MGHASALPYWGGKSSRQNKKGTDAIRTVPFLFSIRLLDFFIVQRGARKLLEKFHYAAFGPKAIISAVARNKRAVPAALGSNQTDVWILRQSGIGKARKRNERIVLSGHHESWHANFARDSQRAGSRVVVGSVRKAAIRRCDHIVKLAQGAHARHPAEIEFPGKKLGLAPHAVLEALHKRPLIHEI